MRVSEVQGRYPLGKKCTEKVARKSGSCGEDGAAVPLCAEEVGRASQTYAGAATDKVSQTYIEAAAGKASQPYAQAMAGEGALRSAWEADGTLPRCIWVG